ncbi:hypothetical protein BWQ96_06535 [Gracilariopsis chorda]|uniref:F-box domain-containing protein n=1 Tax=Gracilariopsis chorda TaxID=448386 RepID=A0A2V3INP4_9FLOR|nr:hypothetical protein BWQ96_06535 [Gracilariopsis chorda]|eukprot:PXF43705.1 hypothetical protein BWQ96_06535 [Gracilariopsis chorda]
MHAKRAIVKPRSTCPIAKPRGKRRDHFAHLPADISTAIIDNLDDRELRQLPKVSSGWASVFTRPDTQPHFRSFIRRRYGPDCKPRDNQCWGSAYLELRRELCHLCPDTNIAPFVYAGSSSLAVMLPQPEEDTTLVLFPLCRRCFRRLLTCNNDPFVPVVEHAELSRVFPHVSAIVAREALVSTGYLYSDLPRIIKGNVKGIQYTPAKPLTITNPR